MECFVATTGNASRRTSIVVAEPSASRQNCLIANDPANGNRFVSDSLTDTRPAVLQLDAGAKHPVAEHRSEPREASTASK